MTYCDCIPYLVDLAAKAAVSAKGRYDQQAKVPVCTSQLIAAKRKRTVPELLAGLNRQSRPPRVTVERNNFEFARDRYPFASNITYMSSVAP